MIIYDFFKDNFVRAFNVLKNSSDKDLWDNFYANFINKALEMGLEKDIWQIYLLDTVLNADNYFTRLAAAGKIVDSALKKQVTAELSAISAFAREIPPLKSGAQEICHDFTPPGKRTFGAVYQRFLAQNSSLLTENSPEEIFSRLEEFHRVWGFGCICRYSFFEWQGEKGICGISSEDNMRLEHIISYNGQKRELLNNTKAFSEGKGFNNMLLYGERGTGKSSLVRAIGNEFAASGMRMVNLPLDKINTADKLFEYLSLYRQKFIVLLDDISFDAADKQFIQLKSAIEGGLAVLPRNIVLYATSNRRHMVHESWRDRQNRDEIMYLSDTVAEKLALAERFGVTITFLPPDQEIYLEIVEGIAKNEGITIPVDELRFKALQWERWHHGRSGRTARQFINSLAAEGGD
jgi:predicted AAA+ superfamily ATPase